MKTIWKFPINPGPQTVNIPIGAKFLSVNTQGVSSPAMWFEVDSNTPPEARHFVVFGTGFDMGDFEGKYLGTFLIEMGALVFHLYEHSTVKTVVE